VIAYCRVSTAEQQVNGHGMNAQEDAIRAHAAARNWLLVDVVRDRGSGKSLERPALMAVLEKIAAGEVDGIVVAKLERLSRSIVDFGRLLEWLRDASAFVSALDFELHTSTPQGELMAGLLVQFSQFERRLIGERTRVALAAARAARRQVGGPSTKDHPELRAQIRAWRDDGWKLAEIAAELNRLDVPTLRGAAEWTVPTIQTALGYRRPGRSRKDVELPAVRRRR
jgi:DNA invertase Pin-like site-specific DNA recombinase